MENVWKNCNLRRFSREYDCLAKIGTKELRKRSRCYWEIRSNVKGQHAPTQTDNQRQKYMKQNHLLLQILAVIGRCGSHLMIVMIFVTHINLKRSRNFRLSPWILPLSHCSGLMISIRHWYVHDTINLPDINYHYYFLVQLGLFKNWLHQLLTRL